jgi:hypothetical protein
MINDNVLYHSSPVLANSQTLLGRLFEMAAFAQVICCPMAFLDPSAFIGTNPGDLRITSALPVILPQLHETMFANLLQSLLRPSNQGHNKLLHHCC